MKVDVYDTYATAPDGTLLHFDVIVPATTKTDTVFSFACDYVGGIDPQIEIQQESCNFCHSEQLSANMLGDIQKQGFCILPMEGCPKPKSCALCSLTRFR